MTEKVSDALRIRTVESVHIAELIGIGRETNLSAWSAQNYLDEMQDAASIMLRIGSGPRETIGFVVGRVIVGEVDSNREAEIYNIAITPRHQHCGFGQMLFDEFAARCRENGVSTIWLEVRESNLPAISFYQKNGFEPVQSRRNFYSNPREHAVLMRLKLE